MKKWNGNKCARMMYLSRPVVKYTLIHTHTHTLNAPYHPTHNALDTMQHIDTFNIVALLLYFTSYENLH